MLAMTKSQTPQRVLVLAVTFFFLASVYFCTTRLFSSSFSREAASPGHRPGRVDLGRPDVPMSYGHYGRPAFEDLTLMASLPREYVPTVDNGRRLVVVGDVHGMDAELAQLLRQVGFDKANDHLVVAGDMVHKGPDSRGVVARLMSLNASAVRGNHEDRILLALAEGSHGASTQLASADAERHRGESEHLAVARSLSPEQVAWLSRLPVILTADPLPIYIVHAGLVPGVRLDKQDPWAVMNMRSLIYPGEKRRKKANQDLRRQVVAAAKADPDDDDDDDARRLDRAVAIPVENHTGEQWAHVWSRQQKRLPRPHRRTVIYGHDAKKGLVLGLYTFGLDSGCVRGGALTAMIIEATGDGGFKHATSQVPCNKAPRKHP